MVNRKSPLLTGLLIMAIAAGGWIGGEELVAHAQTDTKSTPPAPAVRNTGQKSGEEVFQQNCSRCHKPPMSIAPRITGTVIMHMRVRAKLSKQDEQALLRYLAP